MTFAHIQSVLQTNEPLTGPQKRDSLDFAGELHILPTLDRFSACIEAAT